MNQSRNNPESQPSYSAGNIPTMNDADREEQARQAELAEVPDFYVFEAMSHYGGSFVAALAEAGRRADAINLAKLKATWPEYWQKYAEMGLKIWLESWGSK